MAFDLVFFGGTGDLVWRKLMPALFQAFRHGTLPDGGRIIGVGRVGGPVAYIWSDDLGKTWKQGKVPDIGAMAFDVKFLDEKVSNNKFESAQVQAGLGVAF